MGSTGRMSMMGRMAMLAGIAGALGVLGSPASAAPDSPPVSIIGGIQTTTAQYPSVVGLVIGGSNLCTGTLITPEWVLTAAHCVDPAVLKLGSQDEVTSSVEVHFDTVDVINDPNPTRMVRAIATFKDPMFDQAHLGSHDIGMIQLATPVVDIMPSPINLSANMAPVGTTVTIVGYGSTEQGALGTVGVEFELKNRTSVSCESLGIGSDTNLLCFSQTDNKGTCQGDSGGPSFASIDGKSVLVAVTSFGDQQCASYGANTRVDIEQQFMVQHVPELIGCLTDSDCPMYRTCFSHRCIAEPFGPNGIGTVCSTAADCDSSECAISSQDGRRCSITCTVSDSTSCPGGFECLRATGDLGACWPTSGGCCDAGGAGGPPTMFVGIGLVALGLRRKRR
jgi:V8-like Glu-specific endopeptidase